ncbi:hypothetical protein L1F30_04095 [Simiduia sp. 21SJ11W-1]|uniref:ApeP family dehydratase n=1 Tax=Simiduia sp. 21SJ11W-1 TaxID=2909669 RepID=UPI00209EC5C2|nr:hypothetical protein [Simiduia sp. 21SJ11W-1]UTA48729.1 hypothetical protein L1F30_04095 [Simiduia sp. 21SJ11W-1]
MDNLATFIEGVAGEPPRWPLPDLVPHAKPMSLLDEVVRIGEGELLAKVTLNPDSVFAGPEGVPAHVGIEYMAQSIAAFAGHAALARGERVQLGFLVGTRRYQSNVAHFAPGETLWVHVQELVQGDNGLSVFECQIRSHTAKLEANLNVFQPEDAAQFLAQA